MRREQVEVIVRTLLLFDGLGGRNDALPARLAEQYRSFDNRLYFHHVFTVLDEVLAYVGDDVHATLLPDGLPLRRWLEEPNAAPAELPNSILAGICVHIHQVCHLQPTAGSDRDAVVGSLGHSIGLQAALVAGMRLRRMDQFLAAAASSLKLVALSLIRGHQLAGGVDPRPELVRRYRGRDTRGLAPSPMASLTGLRRSDLDGVLRQYRKEGCQAPALALVNSPQAHVLSGSTDELLDFYFAHQDAFTQAQVSWSFLPNTIPFHSQRLLPVVRRVNQDLGFIGPLPGAEHLALPVYATDAPRNLQAATDLVDEFLQQVLVRPVEWELATAYAIRDAGIERVVDCGPGPGARRFVRECLDADARKLRFESVQQFARRR